MRERERDRERNRERVHVCVCVGQREIAVRHVEFFMMVTEFSSTQFGLSLDKVGIVFFANAIPYALFAPISGLLADKIVRLNVV